MMPFRLPPAGNHIGWSDVVDESALRGLFTPWEPAFFASGTAALAALLVVLRTRFPRRDEVVFAAYNCPSMVSAARFAGCNTRLVDLAPGSLWMEISAVEKVLSSRTLAIIGVDLFGIPERHALLRELAIDNGCVFIQDSAQAFPKRAGDGAWQGDAIILSFGRGKPVSLLGGGAVLTRDRCLVQDLVQTATLAEEDAEASCRRRVAAYNWLRHPRLYWLPSSVPALGLGETRFTPLDRIAAMPIWLKRRVPVAVAAYRARGAVIEAQYATVVPSRGVVDLARSCGVASGTGLSRYPFLAPDRGTRDGLVERLGAYGASRFYGRILPEIAGVQELLGSDESFPHARQFADRLFTLPTHDGVRALDVTAMGRLLGSQPFPVSVPLRESAE